jgi:hypothetical protein
MFTLDILNNNKKRKMKVPSHNNSQTISSLTHVAKKNNM